MWQQTQPMQGESLGWPQIRSSASVIWLKQGPREAQMEGVSCSDKKRQPFMHKNKGWGYPGGQELREGVHCWCLICSRRLDRFIQKEQLWVLSRAFQLLLGLKDLWALILSREIQVLFTARQTIWGGKDSKGHQRGHLVSKMPCFGFAIKHPKDFFLPVCRKF